MAVSKRLRYEVLRRDGYRCRYCGASAETEALTVDHVIPVSLGGSDDPSNLCAACGPCNTGKSSSAPDTPLVDDVAEDALRWAAAMRQAAAIQAANVESRAGYVKAFDEAWCHWTYADDTPVSRPPDWAGYIGRLHDLGLEQAVLVALVHDVLPRQVSDSRMWRYFCGAVRNVLAEREEIAERLLAEEGA